MISGLKRQYPNIFQIGRLYTPKRNLQIPDLKLSVMGHFQFKLFLLVSSCHQHSEVVMQPSRFAFLPSVQPLLRRTQLLTVPLICRPKHYVLAPKTHSFRITATARVPPPETPKDVSKGERRSKTSSSSTIRISRTFMGRVLVEVLSILLGVLLLLVILFRRLWQFVSFSVLRAISWIANVRHLGKKAFVHFARGDKITIPTASIAHSVRRIYGAAFPRAMHSRTLVSDVDVTETKPSVSKPEWHDVQDDKENIDVEGRPSQHGHPSRPPSAKRRLILLRHAKTQWSRDGSITDQERELSDRGREEARLVGIELARRSWTPDVLISSNAVRTVQTFEMLNLSADIVHSAICIDDLYYAVTGDEMAVAINNNIPTSGFPSGSTFLVVCHNPGCEELVEQLTGQRLDMGTGCAVLMEYDDRKRYDLHYRSTNGVRDDDCLFSIVPEHWSSQWSIVEVIRPSTITSGPVWKDD